MGKRYAGDVLMTVAALLRSGMTLKCHVPFWRAVEEVTPLLTLIAPYKISLSPQLFIKVSGFRRTWQFC